MYFSYAVRYNYLVKYVRVYFLYVAMAINARVVNFLSNLQQRLFRSFYALVARG